MIAMARSASPVLIADEPTTALDVTIQAQIPIFLLASCSSEAGMAVMLITHDPRRGRGRRRSRWW